MGKQASHSTTLENLKQYPQDVNYFGYTGKVKAELESIRLNFLEKIEEMSKRLQQADKAYDGLDIDVRAWKRLPTEEENSILEHSQECDIEFSLAILKFLADIETVRDRYDCEYFSQHKDELVERIEYGIKKTIWEASIEAPNIFEDNIRLKKHIASLIMRPIRILGKIDPENGTDTYERLVNGLISDKKSLSKEEPQKPKKAIEPLPNFSIIRQGAATSKFTKIKPRKGEMTVDPLTGTATIKREDFSITFKEFQKIALKTSTHQLLDALLVELTEKGGQSLVVKLPLDEYMTKRGLKDKKQAREQIEADLETLFNASISFQQQVRKGKKVTEKDFYDLRLIGAKSIKRGVIQVSFTPEFNSLLADYKIMPYPEQLWELNSKYTPNSYYFLRKIAEHRNMNFAKSNRDLIAVETLLRASPELPSYEEVSKSRHYNQRIIAPFERDMSALEHTLTWEYCHRNGAPLTSDELRNMDYQTFTKLIIKINWKSYPERAPKKEKEKEKKEK